MHQFPFPKKGLKTNPPCDTVDGCEIRFAPPSFPCNYQQIMVSTMLSKWCEMDFVHPGPKDPPPYKEGTRSLVSRRLDQFRFGTGVGRANAPPEVEGAEAMVGYIHMGRSFFEGSLVWIERDTRRKTTIWSTKNRHTHIKHTFSAIWLRLRFRLRLFSGHFPRCFLRVPRALSSACPRVRRRETREVDSTEAFGADEKR